ncbi:hypothetical protein Rhsp01_49450 [Rhizobium sp. NBRC 114257]|uniref:Uncharacterized protein n=1 Tax=Rhizobium dioscoreae TaxID=2653122 RepID=A0ABQ0ZB10_9HYPH|nr:hypothetical protein RsS93_51860 [Rhizobium dioscoreae]GLU83769.1 hypothetical protein Rhsp01_49450 [Rhizobium sp. NBRC 114257]
MSLDSRQGYAFAVAADHRAMIRLIITLDEVTRLVTIIAIRKRSFQNLRHLEIRMPVRRHVLIRFYLQQDHVCFWCVRHANTAKPDSRPYGAPGTNFATSQWARKNDAIDGSP